MKSLLALPSSPTGVQNSTTHTLCLAEIPNCSGKSLKNLRRVIERILLIVKNITNSNITNSILVKNITNSNILSITLLPLPQKIVANFNFIVFVHGHIILGGFHFNIL